MGRSRQPCRLGRTTHESLGSDMSFLNAVQSANQKRLVEPTFGPTFDVSDVVRFDDCSPAATRFSQQCSRVAKWQLRSDGHSVFGNLVFGTGAAFDSSRDSVPQVAVDPTPPCEELNESAGQTALQVALA